MRTWWAIVCTHLPCPLLRVVLFSFSSRIQYGNVWMCIVSVFGGRGTVFVDDNHFGPTVQFPDVVGMNYSRIFAKRTLAAGASSDPVLVFWSWLVPIRVFNRFAQARSPAALLCVIRTKGAFVQGSFLRTPLFPLRQNFVFAYPRFLRLCKAPPAAYAPLRPNSAGWRR